MERTIQGMILGPDWMDVLRKYCRLEMERLIIESIMFDEREISN